MLWLRRTNFLLIVLTFAFAEGFYLRPLGFGWVVAVVALTITLAIAWMRGRWIVKPALRSAKRTLC